MTTTLKKKAYFNIVLNNGEEKLLLISSIGSIDISMIIDWLYKELGKVFKDKELSEENIKDVVYTNKNERSIQLFIPAIKFED